MNDMKTGDDDRVKALKGRIVKQFGIGQDVERPFDLGLLAMAEALIQPSIPAMAGLCVSGGLSVKLAYAIAHKVQGYLVMRAAETGEAMGAEPFASDKWITPDLWMDSDWEALAKSRGETFDREEWDAFMRDFAADDVSVA